MATSTQCWPWWHQEFASIPQTPIRSGCGVGGDGNVSCDPDGMRADAEIQIAALGFPRSIDLNTYSLARTIQSEVGNGSVEEKVALGELTLNRAKREGTDANGILLYRSGNKFYGPIHGVGTGVSTAPYGRWASTSQDPTLQTLLIADLVASGQTNDFTGGADDQDGPEAWIHQGQNSLTVYVQNLARNGKYWVGPLPGIDHWRTFLQFTPGPLVFNKDELLQRGIEALSLPAERPSWPADMPSCAKPAKKALIWIVGILSTIGGAWYASHRVR